MFYNSDRATRTGRSRRSAAKADAWRITSRLHRRESCLHQGSPHMHYLFAGAVGLFLLWGAQPI